MRPRLLDNGTSCDRYEWLVLLVLCAFPPCLTLASSPQSGSCPSGADASGSCPSAELPDRESLRACTGTDLTTYGSCLGKAGIDLSVDAGPPNTKAACACIPDCEDEMSVTRKAREACLDSINTETKAGDVSAPGDELPKEKHTEPAVRKTEGKELLKAAETGNEAKVQALLSDGIDPNIHKDDAGRTALMVAARKGRQEVVESLLKFTGIDVNAKDNVGRTALHLAVGKGRDSIVKAMMKVNGLDVNAKTKNDGFTALMVAARKGRQEGIELLLKFDGIDVNAKDNNGNTALAISIAEDRGAVLKMLLKADGISIDSTSLGTELKQSARAGKLAIVQALLSSRVDGLDPNFPDKSGNTPLQEAAVNGHQEIVDELLKASSIEVNAADGYLRNALMKASGKGYVGIVKSLLKVDGIDVNARSRYGWTALHWAAQTNPPKQAVAEALLKFPGIEVNVKGKKGETPLALAEPISALTAALLREHGAIR